MKATEILADPLVEVTAMLLTPPARELYALLWRAGLLEVEHRAPKRPAAEVRELRPAG
ncbi:Rv1535 domain-containing protein [[Mycobacterium] vasticus]|uniref:Rv1535 domain-containing protein n=1 Tax=[Mycobacterium] vasticus TaxID=2875777 RepID=A0ABU5YXZ7_9MYCO|nr:Rv1535 domain-containing protein [Mycolicibacter sp. MYC017]MEB3069570.1 Rv1535 domain-containing protein [Mycolicibacter sp. MYC017]